MQELDANVKHNILIVDDMLSQALVLQEILKDLGHNVEIANTGKSAIGISGKVDFSLIILDVYMPDMDGFKAAEILRDREATEHVPIIFVTATSVSKELEFRGFNKGAVDFIYKPIVPEALLGKVRWLLSLQEESKRLQKTLSIVENMSRQNQLLINNAFQGILWSDINGIINMANPAAIKMLGFREEDILGKHVASFIIQETADEKFDWQIITEKLIDSDDHMSISEDSWFLKNNEEKFQAELNINIIMNSKHECEGVVLIFEDITKRKQAEYKMRYLAEYDSLTGLANRNKLVEFGNSIFNDLSFSCPPAVLFIDLDGFKDVNDNLGHEAGDNVLIDVAKALQSTVGDGGLVARLGGDEFAVFITNADNKSKLSATANNIVSRISEIKKTKMPDIDISASVGVATFPNAGISFSALLKSADKAMYSAKHAGKNRVHFFGQSNDMSFNQSMQMVDILKDFKRDNLLIHYQPIIKAKDNSHFAIEVLLALKVGDKIIKAESFINTISNAQVLRKILEWQIDIASEILNKKSLGYDSVAINLTSLRLNDELFNIIKDKIKVIDTSVKKIYIEIDSDDVCLKSNSSIEFIKNMKKIGVNIIITGVNLGNIDIVIRTYNYIGAIKISRGLTKNFSTDDQRIINSIVYICKQFDVSVGVIGVSKDEMTDLIALGVDLLQGHAISGGEMICDVDKINLL